MTDFSINQTGIQSNKTSDNTKANDYLKLKKEYDRIKSKLDRSDFANSPVAIEKELTFIAKLKAAALKQGLKEESALWEEREQTLYKKLANTASNIPAVNYYKPISFSGVSALGMRKTPANQLDFSQERFVNFFSQGFADENAVKAELQTMCDMGVDVNSAVKLFNVIKKFDSQTGLYTINRDTYKKLLDMKRILLTTREKEREEYNSPINNIGMEKLSVGRNTIIFKDGKVSYISPVEEKSIQCMQEEYDKAVSEEEDALLYDFASSYLDKNGEINRNYIRTLHQLRQAGIIRNQILNLTDKCVNSDGSINKNVMDGIVRLKEAGAMSADIEHLLKYLTDEKTGLINQNDLKNAVILTKSVMKAKDVAALLPAMGSGEEAAEYISRFAGMLDSKQVMQLVEMVCDTKGVPDEDAMDVVNSLLNNSSIFDENGQIEPQKFIGLSEHMLGVAKDFNSSPHVNEDAVAVIFEACRRSMPVADIEKLLHKSLNEQGKIDNTLAKIIWHSLWKNEDVSEISWLLDGCFKNGNVDNKKAQTILNYMSQET